MRDKLSLNLYLKKDKGPDYGLLSALYFLDIENSLPVNHHFPPLYIIFSFSIPANYTPPKISFLTQISLN